MSQRTIAPLFISALLFGALSGNALASDPSAPREVFLALSMGLTFGGDTIDSAYYTDGSSADIKAGGLVQLGLGAEWHRADLPISVRATLNYHADSANASNGSLTLKRIPFELLAHYHFDERFLLGGGLRYVSSNRYKRDVSGDSLNSSAYFDPSLGLVIEAAYKFNKPAQIALRYVHENYKTNGSTAIKAGSYNASHVGVFFNYLL